MSWFITPQLSVVQASVESSRSENRMVNSDDNSNSSSFRRHIGNFISSLAAQAFFLVIGPLLAFLAFDVFNPVLLLFFFSVILIGLFYSRHYRRSSARIRSLEESLGESEAGRESLQEALGTSEERRKSLQGSLGASEKRRKSLQESLGASEKRRKSLQEALSASEAGRRSLEKDLIDSKNEVTSLRESLDLAVRQKEELDKRIQQIHDR